MWKEFEIRHGNEDTVREMLRIKRSVQAKYNTQVGILTQLCGTDVGNLCYNNVSFQVNFMSAQMLAASSQASGTVSDLAPGMKDDMRMLEAKAAHLAKEAAQDKPTQSKDILFIRQVFVLHLKEMICNHLTADLLLSTFQWWNESERTRYGRNGKSYKSGGN